MNAHGATVLVVEDDYITCERFARAVTGSPDFCLLASCHNVAEGMAAIDRYRPRLLLVDLGLPDGSGLQLIRHLSTLCPQSDAVVITLFGDEYHVVAAVEAGASGYLLKDGEAPAVMTALSEVLSGGAPISAAVARHLLRRLRAPGDGNEAARGVANDRGVELGLTRREIDVLVCLSKGLSCVEAARALSMSAHTVTSHVRQIYRKLHVHNRSEAVFEAAQLGLVHI